MRLGDAEGTVVVSARVAASADDAWHAITRGDRLASWCGDLSTSELAPGGVARLAFGDGDFFDLDVRDVDEAARRLHFRWCFLGCGVREDNEIEVVADGDSAATVIVRDSEPRRPREASLALGEGWRDFTSRLQGHLATGERTRYDWRGEVDVWIELPASADDASRTLIAAAGEWLPLDHGASLFHADALVLGDDLLQLGDVAPAGPRAVRFAARPADMGGETSCEIRIQPLGEDTAVLGINHDGFRELDATDARQRQLREQCLEAWLAAATRARTVLAKQLQLSGATSAAAPGAS